jgi:hypothetical protein
MTTRCKPWPVHAEEHRTETVHNARRIQELCRQAKIHNQQGAKWIVGEALANIEAMATRIEMSMLLAKRGEKIS